MRFAGKTEAAFKQYVEPTLVQRSFLVSAVMSVVLTGILAGEIWTDSIQTDAPQRATLEPLNRAWSILRIILFAAVSLLCLLRVRWGFLISLNWEAVLVFLVVVALQKPILSRPSMHPYWCEIVSDSCHDVDMTDVVHLGQEIRAMFFIYGAIAGVHLFLPIRSCRGWIVDVIGVGEYSVCALLAANRGTYILPLSEAIITLIPLPVVVMFAYTGGRWNEKHTRGDWLAQGKLLEHQDHFKQQHLGMSRILSRLCDSLVHLGPDFEICQPCPQLGALLFRGETVGRNFCDFIASEPLKARFTRELRESAEERSSAEADECTVGMMNLSLLDSNGKIVKVYAHHAYFHLSDGRTQYMLGLIETGDRPAPLSQGAPLNPLPLPELPGELCMSVESNNEGDFVITSMKPGMRSLLTEASEGGLAHSICDMKDRDQFLGWLQNSCNKASSTASQRVSTCHRMSVKVSPPHGEAILYRARVSGTFESAEGGYKATLRLSPPCQPSTRSSRSPRSPRSSRSGTSGRSGRGTTRSRRVLQL